MNILMEIEYFGILHLSSSLRLSNSVSGYINFDMAKAAGALITEAAKR